MESLRIRTYLPAFKAIDLSFSALSLVLYGPAFPGSTAKII